MTDVTPSPAPQTPAVPVAASTEVATATPPKKSGALGGFALVLAILAILGDLAVIIFGVISFVGLANNFDTSTFEVSSFVTALGAFGVIGAVGFFGGIILALLSLLFGIIAIAKRRGRVAGVFAVILSILVLITHGSLALALAQAGAGLAGLLPGSGS
ncbi:MAG: hypothetical protein ABIQ01_06650 [Pseudolysinimonas sp.]